MSKTKWSAEKTWKFVIEYRTRECLWNTNLQFYKDRQVKGKHYKELAEMFGMGGVNDVKIKIKNLRTTYIQEYKKIQESIKANANGNEGGTTYVPSLVWYKEMDAFLNYTGAGKFTPPTLSEPENKIDDPDDINIKEELIEVTQENLELANVLDTSQSQQPNYDLRLSHEEVTQQLMPKKRKQHSYNNQQTNLDDSYFEEHEFDIFGKSVAKQLKSFSSIAAALRVQSKIQSLLTEERIQDQIAASDANLRQNTANQRFFYNQGCSDSQWLNSVAVNGDISNLSNESCTSASLNEEHKEYGEAFGN